MFISFLLIRDPSQGHGWRFWVLCICFVYMSRRWMTCFLCLWMKSGNFLDVVLEADEFVGWMEG